MLHILKHDFFKLGSSAKVDSKVTSPAASELLRLSQLHAAEEQKVFLLSNNTSQWR